MTEQRVNEERAVEVSLEFVAEKLDIEVLGKAARSLREILHDIEQAVTGEPPRATWESDTSTLRSLASPNGATEATLLRVAHDAHEAFSRAQAPGVTRWPETLGPKGQRAIRAILRLLDQVETITVKAEREQPVTLRRPEEGLAVIERPQGYREFSEVEGTLDIISVRKHPRFSVKQRSGLAVGCTFPAGMFERVKDSLGSTVVVEGLVRYRADGTPVSITDIISMRIKAPPEGSITELRGTLPNLTSGVPAGEYVRQIREEDDGH